MQEQPPQLDEQLSAVLDGEASELELRRFLQRLDELGEAERNALYRQWDRYQRISAGLADEAAASQAAPDFVGQVASQLGTEPVAKTINAEEHGAEGARASIWSKMAVAASFALAVTVGVQQLHINSQSEQLQLAASAANTQPLEAVRETASQPSLTGQGVQVASAVSTNSIDEAPIDEQERQRRLQDYLMEHANHAAQQNGQGIVPFARTAGFEAE